MATREITIDQFLTPMEILKCVSIWRKSTTPAKEICETVIKPNMARINTKLGQENDAMYLAYAVEYVLNQTEKRS
jgi:hypothetical protein